MGCGQSSATPSPESPPTRSASEPKIAPPQQHALSVDHEERFRQLPGAVPPWMGFRSSDPSVRDAKEAGFHGKVADQGGGSIAVPEVANEGAGREPHDDAAVEEVLMALRTLAAQPPLPRELLPVRSHAERLPSGERGVGASFLEAIRRFYNSSLQSTMEDICKSVPTCVVTLTLSTGLSVAESVALVAERDSLPLARAQIGRALTFFS